MTTPQSHYVLCCERELHVEVWNPAASQTRHFWHGLTRTGRDFHTLASHLSPHYRLLILILSEEVTHNGHKIQ